MEMNTPSELDTIAELARLGKTTSGGICLCCGQALDAERRALDTEGVIKSLAGKGQPTLTSLVAEAMGTITILSMAKQSAEVIRTISELMHVQGKMPDAMYHRMVAGANQIREDALRLEGREE
jgi:hypothetical protein